MKDRSCGRVFFFQAEDGIRDFHVTGVQTCALPIYRSSSKPCRPLEVSGLNILSMHSSERWVLPVTSTSRLRKMRSEERRVGKECRSRWARYRENKKVDD